MANYAKIEDWIVTQIIDASAEHINTLEGEWILASSTAQVGWSYNGSAFSPPAAAAAPPRMVLTAQEWVATWTPDEWRAMKTDAAGGTAEALELDQLLDTVKAGGAVDLESEFVTPLYDFLEENEYIDAERREELTAGVGGSEVA